GTRQAAVVMAPDHVGPRRGQIAYDRRDILVLACRACNALKRGMAPLAFLLAVRSRASNLVHYGKHLSHGLLEMAKPIAKSFRRDQPRVIYGKEEEEDESPYKD